MMRRLFSNGPNKDFVIKIFERACTKSSQLSLAAPYFNFARPIVEAANSGKQVRLLIGINAATSPQAIMDVLHKPGVHVRYFTHRFHAKIYVFDDEALLGSANLTDAGMMGNREGVVHFDTKSDHDAVEEMRLLFAELWGDALVLTPEKLEIFAKTLKGIAPKPDLDSIIEKAIGRAVPRNINVESHKTTKERIFLERLRQQVYEEYRPAFTEVQDILSANNLHRAELASLGATYATNRFLNWVRLTEAPDDASWESTPFRSPPERRSEIIRLGNAWIAAKDNRVHPGYAEQLATVQQVFGSENAIVSASKDELSEGLVCIHAFAEQLRFVKGGFDNLVPTFWAENSNDDTRVRKTIAYFLYGEGDFIQRLHDILYDYRWKIAYFGLFCALELFGSVKPEQFPPVNGRMAKALRYIGFPVKG
jgi:PLD-like domain